MMRAGRLGLLSVVLLGAASAAPRALKAQVTASLTATATVDNTALATALIQNLAFGTVIPGTATTVNPRTNTTTRAFVRIQGSRNANIIITFTLPTVLRTGTGPYTMPLTFGTQSACGSRAAANCTFFNPQNAHNVRIANKAPPNNEYWVYLGGTVTPAASQHGGVYSATIVMTVTY